LLKILLWLIERNIRGPRAILPPADVSARESSTAGAERRQAVRPSINHSREDRRLAMKPTTPSPASRRA